MYLGTNLNEEEDDRDQLTQDEIQAILQSMKAGYSSDPEIRSRAIEKASYLLRHLEAAPVWRVEKLTKQPRHSLHRPVEAGENSDQGSGPDAGDPKRGWVVQRRSIGRYDCQ